MGKSLFNFTMDLFGQFDSKDLFSGEIIKDFLNDQNIHNMYVYYSQIIKKINMQFKKKKNLEV